ncbi:hypothetical protein K3495_g6852 [Podosphaera aphanis]|nr:hypothetical protein K3495_g6852 [Podosphaera aphanis]
MNSMMGGFLTVFQFDVNDMDNDTRGWVMAVVSGIACIVGASIIFIDVLLNSSLPSKWNFRIQESDVFLASSLSLSFGVMAFSALYSMLPHSKLYLIHAGYSPSQAAWILLGGFLGGFVGIQIITRFLHKYIPSHVVDCDHTHDGTTRNNDHEPSRSHSYASFVPSRAYSPLNTDSPDKNSKISETSPLLSGAGVSKKGSLLNLQDKTSISCSNTEPPCDRRPSMLDVQKKVISFVKDTKSDCDSGGPCFGYTGPCGKECFTHLVQKTTGSSHPASLVRSNTGKQNKEHDWLPVNQNISPEVATGYTSPKQLPIVSTESDQEENQVNINDDVEAQHHHHVPENAFLSIGLQTSIAIALHKLPEGFITYATNHANPSLGLSVFLALFIHNITEGFALALPLFLALNSRWRAMFWASILGGISQPLGAGIAVAWLKIAGYKGYEPDMGAYGCMFAITAGIMTSVALQLFVESLSLNHNRNLCIAFGFIGMSIMGMSNALTS